MEDRCDDGEVGQVRYDCEKATHPWKTGVMTVRSGR